MRKTLFRAIGGLTLAVLVAATVFVVNLVWFRPFSLNLFYEKVFVSFMLDNPELLTMVGIAEQFGYRRHNAHLNDVSLAKVEHDFRRWHEYLEDLKSYDLTGQTPDQRISTRVLTWFIQGLLDGERFRFHDYPVNQLFGVQNQTPDFLINQHRIADRRGADDYLSRLGEFGRKYDQVLDGVKLRESKGVVPPRFVIDRVLVEMRAFVSLAPAQNPLCVNFAKKVDALKDVDEADKPGLKARCERAVEQVVKPAYSRLIAFFEGQRDRATDVDGVWKLPEGDAYYAWRLRQQTTTSMTPQQVHALGLSEVERIEGEMRAILTTQGELREGETPAKALVRLGREPRFLFTNDDEGRRAALAEYKRMIDDQLVRSREVIGLSPKAPIEVQRVPEFKQKTAPGAYYQPPALDGSRPGIFYANLRDMNALPKFGMRTLSIHEGVPGHHFQIALAQERQGGPTFRKLLPFTAYAEGWALYAEWLGTELGVYRDDPYGNLGRLQAEMFRAVRLVVDTGIHAQRWTRQQAIDYMLAHTGMAEGEVVAEIERYIVDPGQACAYKVGMLAIRAARERAEKALGTKWNREAEKAFHDVVLQGGSLPLAILDEQVDAWIAGRRP
jgi:uncharacterized protein (DUF885 family)